MTSLFERFETVADHSAIVLLLAALPTAAVVLISAAF